MDDYGNWRGKTVIDETGAKIGELGDIYVDEKSGRPTWATVKTGLFGTKENFFPISKSKVQGEEIMVQATVDQVKDAPKIDTDEILDTEEERALYEHYKESWGDEDSHDENSEGAVESGGGMFAHSHGDDDDDDDDTRDDESENREARGAVGHDTSGPTTDDAMTRSEEQLHVGTESREASRVRLKKYVVTENVTKTVPVSREEVRVEREPITNDNRDEAMSGPEISEEEHEVVLNEERPVVSKEAVPVERVRLDKETVTDEETVSEDVRKEQIDIDGGGDTSRDSRPRV